jgi:hypothetical protein
VHRIAALLCTNTCDVCGVQALHAVRKFHRGAWRIKTKPLLPSWRAMKHVIDLCGKSDTIRDAKQRIEGS